MPPKKHMNWTAVYQQLEKGRQALQNALNPPAEQVDEKLRQRAKKLQQHRQILTEQQQVQTPFLIIEQNNENYAIHIRDVLEIQSYQACVPLPGASSASIGVINHKGQLKTILSLSHLLNTINEAPPPNSKIVFLRTHNLGIRVDQVIEIRKISDNQWRKPPTETHNGITGLGPHNLISLNVGMLLANIITQEPSHT